jgi:L-threonylcarbamoyladenylate synthase
MSGPPIVPDDETGRARAIAVLRTGGIVAMPTDTVYGIGCALDAPRGIERLFEVKARPPDRAIMLLLANEEQADQIGVMGPAALALADAFWPGGLSLVLPRREGAALPHALTGGAPTVGVRVPDHPCPRALAAAGGPIPVTSANRSGEPELRTAADIAGFLAGLDLVVDGGLAHGGPPSTVVDTTDERTRVLRAGAIDADAVRRVLEAVGLDLA